jgi:hypothetical protein
VPNGAGCLNAKITILSGEIHIGLTDVELNAGGYEIVRLNGIKAVPDYTIYFNDLPLNDNSNIDPGYLKATGPAGINSAGGVHRWERPETVLTEGYTGTPTHTGDYGNDRFMDHWAYDSSLNKVFTPLTCFTVLSLRFDAVKAQRVNNAAALQWLFNSHGSAGTFVIERATHGSAFRAIGTVYTNAASGNFNFTDSVPPQQAAFYRIRARFGSQTMLSNIVQVSAVATATAVLRVWPNPAHGQVQAEVPGTGTGVLRLYAPTGQCIWQQQGQASQKWNINMDNRPAGWYMLEWQGSNGVRIFNRLIKSNQ